MQSDFGRTCQDFNHTYIDLLDEGECRRAEKLFPNSSFQKTVWSSREPKACLVNGSNIYWNTIPSGAGNSSIGSICKAGE